MPSPNTFFPGARWACAISIAASTLTLTACVTPPHVAVMKQADKLREGCQQQWSDSKFDSIRDSVPWNMPSVETAAQIEPRTATPAEQQAIQAMLQFYGSCRLQEARLTYIAFPTKGAASFYNRASKEIKIIEALSQGKITFEAASKYRYQVISDQFSVILADDVQRAEAYKRSRAAADEEMLKRSIESQNRSKPVTTNTNCWKDSLGMVTCTSTTQ